MSVFGPPHFVSVWQQVKLLNVSLRTPSLCFCVAASKIVKCQSSDPSLRSPSRWQGLKKNYQANNPSEIYLMVSYKYLCPQSETSIVWFCGKGLRWPCTRQLLSNNEWPSLHVEMLICTLGMLSVIALGSYTFERKGLRFFFSCHKGLLLAQYDCIF